MKRHTSLSLGEVTDEQLKALEERGYGTGTSDIVALAIDRMYREELGREDPVQLATELINRFMRAMKYQDEWDLAQKQAERIIELEAELKKRKLENG